MIEPSTPSPSPSPSVGDGTVTQREWLDALLVVLDRYPWALFASLIATSILFLAALTATVWGLIRAGRYAPPVVVVTVVLGITAMVSLLVLALRPEIQTLEVAVGSAIGGLAGALGTAFSVQSPHPREEEKPPDEPDEIDPLLDEDPPDHRL